MRSSVLSLAFILFIHVHAQWNPLGVNFTPIPPGTFQGGVFDPNWGNQLQQQIQQQIKDSMQQLGMGNGNNNVVITTENGNTVVKVTIGGKPYSATFPGTNLSIFTSSATYNSPNGQLVDVFTITVNDQTYVYTTTNGHTTVTNGSGQAVSGGGPFHVTSR
ncbi:unnamed protein product [Haemonchus placei]|uniref:Secreted protein n=1 Tax=Haemonchus placei TaxID=6290 RepID=A0A0N4X2T8_HAEPC|nr:unnamed protein product [Haemonchus placei]